MSESPNTNIDLCSICLSPLVQSGKDLYTTTCQHQFHFECLTKNIQAQNNECPLCRTLLNSLVDVIHKPAQSPAPPVQVLIQTSPPSTTTGIWSTLRRSMINPYNWISGSSTPSRANIIESEDRVDEEAVRALSARMQAARRTSADATTELASVTATTTLEFGGQVLNQTSNIYGMVTLKAPSLLSQAASEKQLNELRVPVDIVCVVDQSGSMQGEKMILLKETLDYIIEQMSPLDRLAIISFDTKAYNRSNGLLMMTATKKRNLHTIVTQTIHANGGTYIGCGLEMGIEIFNNRRSKNPLGAMLLLTDGQDNQTHDYTALMQTLPEGVVCHTFGYGLGHKAALLSQLAEQGHGGTFTFIDQVNGIDLAFATALGSFFTCIAQNLNVELEFDGEYTVTHCHTIYKHEPVTLPARQLTFKLHDLNAEENRNLVFQLHVPTLIQPPNDNNVIGYVSMKYTDAISGHLIQTPFVPFVLVRPAELSPHSALCQVNYAVDLQRNRAETSRVLREAVHHADYARARKLLNVQLAKIRASVSAQDPLCQQLIRDLEYQYSSQDQFQTTMTNMYMQHGQERATYSTVTTISANCYMTSGQERFRSIVRR